jgi:hypothetical protein
MKNQTRGTNINVRIKYGRLQIETLTMVNDYNRRFYF